MPTYKSEPYTQSEELEDQEEPLRRRCRHIFTAGRRCGSPSLRSEQFCYYHHATRRPVAAPNTRRNRTDLFDLPDPEDRDAIRVAVTQVMHAIARNAIDLKRAGMLLYSFQISLCALPPQPRPALLTVANSNPVKDMVVDTVLDDNHGVIAPEAEYEEPEEFKPRKSLARRMLEEVERYEARQAKEAAERAVQEVANAAEPAGETPAEAVKQAVAAPLLSATSAPSQPQPQRPAAIDLRAAAELSDHPDTPSIAFMSVAMGGSTSARCTHLFDGKDAGAPHLFDGKDAGAPHLFDGKDAGAPHLDSEMWVHPNPESLPGTVIPTLRACTEPHPPQQSPLHKQSHLHLYREPHLGLSRLRARLQPCHNRALRTAASAAEVRPLTASASL